MLPPVVEVNDANKRCQLTEEYGVVVKGVEGEGGTVAGAE